MLEIIIGNNKYSGYFENGSIISGIIDDDKWIYSGEFKNTKLHGKGVMKSKYNGNLYIGTFNDGKLIEGEKYDKNNNLIERGLFIIRSLPNLIEGDKYDKKYSFHGKFVCGFLQEGKIIYSNNVIYNGKFNNGFLYDGCVDFIDLNYKVKYSILYDRYHNENILHNCDVEYKGNLNKLSNKKIMLLLCSGQNSKEAYRFYQDNCKKFETNILKMLYHKIIPTTERNMKGLNQIINNYTYYKNLYTEENNLADCNAIDHSGEDYLCP